jgi:hypothetical protein
MPIFLNRKCNSLLSGYVDKELALHLIVNLVSCGDKAPRIYNLKIGWKCEVYFNVSRPNSQGNYLGPPRLVWAIGKPETFWSGPRIESRLSGRLYRGLVTALSPLFSRPV